MGANHTFFIVMGVVGLLPLLNWIWLELTKGEEEEGVCYVVLCGLCFSIPIGCFLLGWLIYGSVIVFGMEDPPQPDNCQYSTYKSAYIVTVLSKFTLLNN